MNNLDYPGPHLMDLPWRDAVRIAVLNGWLQL